MKLTELHKILFRLSRSHTEPRQSMSALKSLTFTTLPKIGANPTLDRRTNMIARLEEQKLLLNDPNYIRTSRTWLKKNGELTPIDRQQRVLPWWRVNADGSYVFFVRLGSKPIEFEKGKNAIAVPSLDKMPLVINILEPISKLLGGVDRL
jgi:hypothetical protein